MRSRALPGILFVLALTGPEVGAAEPLEMRLDFHVEVLSPEDCVGKVQKSVALGSAVSSTTVTASPDAETFCRSLFENLDLAGGGLPRIPFLKISLPGFESAPPAEALPAPPPPTEAKAAIDFFITLELAGYDDCVTKFTLIDRYAEEVGASENVNGASGAAPICRSLFPDLTSLQPEGGGP